jgi:hypothetical protein
MLLINDVGKKYVLLYDTMTLNTKMFCDKVKKKYGDKIAVHSIKEILNNFGYYKVTECEGNKIEVHLVTYTIMQGEVPQTTLDLLEKYKFKDIVKTISSTGQKNWGKDLFAVAVDEVNKLYPNIEKGLKIELQGTSRDVDNMAKMILGDDF